MKPKEDNYMDDLFQSARSEKSQLSYKEVADSFLSNTSPTLVATVKSWFLKNISLNSIFMMAVGIISIALFWSSFSEKSSVENKIPNEVVTNTSSTSSIPLEESQIFKIEQPVEKIEQKTKLKIENQIAKNNLVKTSESILPKKGKSVSAKTTIEKSPKIQSVSIEKIKKQPTPQKEIKLKNTAVVKNNNIITEKKEDNLQPEGRQQGIPNYGSPWVVGEGSISPDWTIGQPQQSRYYLSENELILQKMLDSQPLEKIFEKKDNENFVPLKLLTNFNLPGIENFNYKGKKIRIFHQSIAPDFNSNEPYISVNKFKVKRNKATLKFKYNGYSVFIQLKKVNNKWKYHKFKSQHKVKHDHVNITF